PARGARRRLARPPAERVCRRDGSRPVRRRSARLPVASDLRPGSGRSPRRPGEAGKEQLAVGYALKGLQLPGLAVAGEMADPGVVEDRGAGFGASVEVAAITSDVPDRVEFPPAARDDGVEGVLIEQAEVVGVLDQILQGALADMVPAPGREVDEQHAGVEVVLVGVQAEALPGWQAVPAGDGGDVIVADRA